MSLSTKRLREEYPEFVIGVKADGCTPICRWTDAARVTFLASPHLGGHIDLLVHSAVEPIMEALAAVFYWHLYEFKELAGGTVSCRNIGGTCRTSSHAHGVAVDFNPSKNGYRHVLGGFDDPETQHQEGLLQWGRYTDMPSAMIRDIEAIRMTNGQQALQWGGRWWTIKDPMHFQVRVTKAVAVAGVNETTVIGLADYRRWRAQGQPPVVEDEMYQKVKYKDGFGVSGGEPAVKEWQVLLQALGHDTGGLDGKYGDKSKLAVIAEAGGDGLQIHEVEGARILAAFAEAPAIPAVDLGPLWEAYTANNNTIRAIANHLGETPDHLPGGDPNHPPGQTPENL